MVLEKDPHHAKALYRRSQARTLNPYSSGDRSESKKALVDLHLALQINPNDKIVRQAYNDLKDSLATKTTIEKRTINKLLKEDKPYKEVASVSSSNKDNHLSGADSSCSDNVSSEVDEKEKGEPTMSYQELEVMLNDMKSAQATKEQDGDKKGAKALQRRIEEIEDTITDYYGSNRYGPSTALRTPYLSKHTTRPGLNRSTSDGSSSSSKGSSHRASPVSIEEVPESTTQTPTPVTTPVPAPITTTASKVSSPAHRKSPDFTNPTPQMIEEAARAGLDLNDPRVLRLLIEMTKVRDMELVEAKDKAAAGTDRDEGHGGEGGGYTATDDATTNTDTNQPKKKKFSVDGAADACIEKAVVRLNFTDACELTERVLQGLSATGLEHMLLMRERKEGLYMAEGEEEEAEHIREEEEAAERTTKLKSIAAELLIEHKRAVSRPQGQGQVTQGGPGPGPGPTDGTAATVATVDSTKANLIVRQKLTDLLQTDLFVYLEMQRQEKEREKEQGNLVVSGSTYANAPMDTPTPTPTPDASSALFDLLSVRYDYDTAMQLQDSSEFFKLVKQALRAVTERSSSSRGGRMVMAAWEKLYRGYRGLEVSGDTRSNIFGAVGGAVFFVVCLFFFL